MTKRERSPDDLPSDVIMNIVREIRSRPGTTKEKELWVEKQYPEFADRYKALMKMACESTFDMDRLEYLIRLREQVRNNERTVDDASKEVGQTMFDIYVKPVVDSIEKK